MRSRDLAEPGAPKGATNAVYIGLVVVLASLFLRVIVVQHIPDRG